MSVHCTIFLPKTLNFSNILGICQEWHDVILFPEIELLFHKEQFVTPCGLTSLSCLIHLSQVIWHQKIHPNFNQCVNVSYWERMDFFRLHNFPSPIKGRNRYNAQGRFAELRKVSDDNDTDCITKEICDTLGIENTSNTYIILSHLLSEAINNVCHHSCSHGFAAAQYFQSNDTVEISVADHGIGFKSALSGSYNINDDAAAITKALELCITGNPPDPARPRTRRNRGVGLTVIHRLIDALQGELYIHSKTGSWKNGLSIKENIEFPGTCLVMKLKRNTLRNFDPRTILRDIMQQEVLCSKSFNVRGRRDYYF